ncbi:MAG: hypothetical protein JXR38_02800, partial [Bacilli bacterium]|nr:hypothetical protein [Bacilli bacterium]
MKVSEFANKICSSIRTGILKMRGFFCRLGKERLSRIGLLIFSVILVTLTLGVIGYYILFPSRGYFHSDTSDTIMWAQAMFDAKWIYNLDFKYAAYLPIGGSLLMAPLIPIFGVSMTTHVWGMLLFYILLLLALAYFFRSIGFSWPYTSFALFVLAFGLAGSEKIREIMYGHIIYYSLGILFLVFSLGMLFRIENLEEEPRTGKNKSLTTVMLALLFLFFVVTGLNGLHSLTLFSIPVLSGYFLERFFRKAPDFFVGRNKKFFVVIGLVLGGIVVGTGLHVLLALLVPQSYADAFASYSAPSEWMGNLDKFVQHWYTLYGVDVSYGDSMKSVDSVINILRIVSGTIILFVPFVALFQYKKYEDHR